MLFRIQIDGSHAEGSEARTRFEKIIRTFMDQLQSNGFIAEYATATPDTTGKELDLLKGKSGDPEPASWQAAVLSSGERAPAGAEAATVGALNADAISKSAERITETGGTSAEAGAPEADTTTDAAPTDAELVKTDNPKLALAPDTMSVDALKAHLAANDYTVAELDAAMDAELAGKNRDKAVSAIKQSRDARVKATEA